MRIEVHDKMEERMKKTISVLKSEFNSVRTGAASPAILNNIYVDYYGASTPLNQLASIGHPEARTLIIKPFDANSVDDVHKAILKSDLGINPTVNEGSIILNFPMMTEENRKRSAKKIKEFAEEAKIALRNERQDAKHELEKMESNNELTEDDLRSTLETVQEIIDDYNKNIEELTENKIEEIMTV